MGGYIKIYIIIIIVIVMVYCCLNNNTFTGLSTFDELKVVENIIVVDSLPIDDKFLFWYCFDLGISGYSTGRLGIAQDRNSLVYEYLTILLSDGITNIELSSCKEIKFTIY